MQVEGVTCSICGESLTSARDLGLHILAKHCDSSVQENPVNPGIRSYLMVAFS